MTTPQQGRWVFVPEGPKQYWLIYFEDAEHRPEIFTDEACARCRYTDISSSWNAHLFVCVSSNCSNAEHMDEQVMLNGLTEEETNATASVSGLSARKTTSHQCDCSAFHWTSSPPKEQGHYWHEWNHSGIKEIVYVAPRPGHDYLAIETGCAHTKRDFMAVIKLGGRWAGPIAAPAEELAAAHKDAKP